jgi:hypothetical protein
MNSCLMQPRTALSALAALVKVLFQQGIYVKTVANVGVYNAVKNVSSG